MKRWITRIALGLLALVALLLVCGVSYEALARHQLASQFSLSGKLVDIGSRSLHIDCRGTGSPTVVFESGLGTSGALDWLLVHDEIARATRACSYSRAGILASHPGVGERDASAIAEELHALLDRAGEPAPLVLVAHSLGGLYALTYTQKFGADVAGLVMIDTFHADSTQRMAAAGLHIPLPLRPLQVASVLGRLGLLRVLGSDAPDDATAAYGPTGLAAMVSELEVLDQSSVQAGMLRQLGDRPLYVLSAGKVEEQFLANAQLTPEQGMQFMAVKRALNEELASWSSHRQHEVVADSGHGIQWEQPERVISATRWVIDAVRAGAAPDGAPSAR